jgi:hypothetical protein
MYSIDRIGIAVCLAAALVASLSACMSPPPAPPHVAVDVTTTFPAHPPPPSATPEGYPELGGTAPGSLVSASLFDAVDPNIVATGATAWRIRYTSLSAVDNVPVEVTGVVIVPDGSAPDDGWPVIAYNHPNTGIQPNCGPSLQEGLANQWGPVSALLMYGFAVVMTDYEGLAENGRHAFLDSAALGRNVIDAVRAARHLRSDLDARWVAFGSGLGGLAAWAANELAATYGSDLQLVGADVQVPWVNVSELAERASARKLRPDQSAVYVQAILGLQATTRPDLDVQRFVHGATYDGRDQLLKCKSAPALESDAVRPTNPSDLVPVDQNAERELADILAGLTVPRQRTAAPMMVTYGVSDPVVESVWVEAALREGCRLGDVIEWRSVSDTDAGKPDVLSLVLWARGRFDGKAAANLCSTILTRP